MECALFPFCFLESVCGVITRAFPWKTLHSASTVSTYEVVKALLHSFLGRNAALAYWYEELTISLNERLIKLSVSVCAKRVIPKLLFELLYFCLKLYECRCSEE